MGLRNGRVGIKAFTIFNLEMRHRLAFDKEYVVRITTKDLLENNFLIYAIHPKPLAPEGRERRCGIYY